MLKSAWSVALLFFTFVVIGAAVAYGAKIGKGINV